MPIYMKYGDIKGEVTAKGHEHWIEVNSFQWGVGRGISSPTGASGDRESSAPSVSEITVTKGLDSSSVNLLQEALAGEGKKVTLDFCKTDKNELVKYLSFELENTMISGYSASSGGDRPQESLSLNFTKISMTETGSDAAGSTGQPSTVGYDLALGKTT
jgi:type VI secretion system secreted protein Hcp